MIKFLISAITLFVGFETYAGVALTQNLGANWVGSPTIMVASNPLTGKEGNWGSSAPYSLGQSFTAPVSGVLTNIQLYGSGRTTANILLYLYDMGPALQYASQPSSVVSGSNSVTTVVSGNLFSTNLAITMVSSGNDSVMQLAFSGADAVPLIGGHEYMFTMISTNSSPMYWDDGGGNPYSGGSAYRQNSFINGSAATDFSLAVTLINTNAGPTIYNCVVDWNNIHQRIDGFGASSAWKSTWTSAQADMFFSTNSGTGTSIDGKTNFPFNGVGLSLLRTRVNTNGTTTYENSIMQMAQARGATVWSTPWSPPPQFKSNNNVNGGNFLSASNQAYASLLAQYVVNMKNNYGVNIYALSIQNEPDVSTSYESCLWTAQQFHDFVPYLKSALIASNVASTKIILAEDEHWQTNYYYAAMSDPMTATNVDIVACHNYDGSPPNNLPAALPTYANTNAVLWETEVSKLSGNGAFDPSMNDAMYWAGRIHLFMTVAQVSAWHYWWLISNNTDNEGLTDVNGIPAQRMYVLGQYSRFVRPGNYRIDLANYNPYAVLATAYKDPVAGGFAIVTANTNAVATTQSFYFTNVTATTVTPWITSSNLSLAVQSPVTVSNNTFSYMIPGMSVVTFVGQGLAGGVPVPDPIPNQIINPGSTLLVTNTAQNANPPLSWTMLNGPTNATVTPGGLFNWTPLSSQADSTNLITVQVTDNASQSATNSFNVVVNPLYGTIPTVTTFTSSANNAVYGTTVTFIATVDPAPTNGETIAFKAAGSTFGTGTLSDGVASYTTSSTQLGVAGSPYSVTAVYVGDGNYQPSVSGAASQIVTAVMVSVASGLTANGKTYNGTTSATISSNNVVLSGVVPADASSVGLSTNSYTALFANLNAGNGIPVTISGLTLTGGAAGNYTLMQTVLSADITPVMVTLAPGSGSLKITNNFTSGNNQFEVYNGLNGFSPPLNGALFTNFQCDVRFAPGSATQTNSSGVLVFGLLQFGTRSNYSQDYFGGASYGITVPATNTGWVHVNIPISVAGDPNLASINDLLIHIYGPSYNPTLVGPSILFVDNIAFVGPGTNYIVDQFNPAGSGGNSYSGEQIGNVWNNWFGASWVANIWDSSNDAIGVAVNNKPYDGTTNATIYQYSTLINTALSGVLSGDLPNVVLSTNGYVASFASAGPGTNITVTVSGLTLAGSAGVNYVIAPLTLNGNISGSSVISTATTLVSSTNNAAYGTAVTFTAMVSPSPTNGESVTFMNDGGTLGAGALSGGVANYTTTTTQLAVPGSPYPVTAVYAGDGKYLASTSSVLSQIVSTGTVTVTADNQMRTFGLPNPVLTASYDGFVTGEDTNVLITLASVATIADANSLAGGYPITASGATTFNYVFNYVPGTLTVVAPPVLEVKESGAAGNQFIFETLPGQTYQVEYKTNLTNAAWLPLGGLIPGTGNPMSVTNNSGADQEFYRLQISQP